MNPELVWKAGQLPPQQFKVFKLLIRDIPSKEIAALLGISYKTVNTHCDLIYKKFDTYTRYGLILRLSEDSPTLKALDSLSGGQ